jgi:gluconolactonase
MEQRTQVDDPRLESLVDPDEPVVRLGGGSTWAEGPVWLPDQDAVVWSDIPGNRLLRWSAATGEVSVERSEVEFHNGHTLDLEGRMIACSHGRRAVERIGADGSVTVLVDRYGSARFNSPNDVVVKSDGTIWFTDPAYGIVKPDEGHPGEREYRDHYVFRFDEITGDLAPVVIDMEDPNGLAFSPDERILYVSDTSAALRADGKHWIRAYDVTRGRRCKNGRVFAEVSPGLSDGFRVDVHGNVWTSSKDSVQVYAPDGTRLGRIPVPERIGNVCFGGPGRDVLYIAATSSLYRLRTRTTGASPLDVSA